MATRTVTFYDELVELDITKSNETLLRTTDAVLVPPRSEALVPVAIPSGFGSGLAIVEPAVNLHKKHLALASAIAQPKQSRTVCKLLNPTNSSIILRRRSTIAVISKLSVDSINVIDNFDSSSWTSDERETETVTLEEQLKVIEQKGIKVHKDGLTSEQYTKLITLLHKNEDLFARDMSDLVGTDVLYYAIDTGDADPIRKRPYRQSPEMIKEMKRQVEEMVKAGIVEESDSPWSSPCLLIKKAGVDKYRFVNDLRAVNKLTKPVYWPMPTMADIFDTAAENNPSIFSNIDLKNAYFQIKLTEESKPKTAFTVGKKKLSIPPHGNGLKQLSAMLATFVNEGIV